ncbi:hypothetical protein ABZP36_008592 [Zizania latifolia]
MANLESCMLFAGTDCGLQKTVRRLLSDLEKELNVFKEQINILTKDKPDEFFKFSKLQTLLLSCNHLTGAIPASLSSVTTLYRLAADQNSFSGWIVGRITKHVKMLYLSCNMLTGEIPSDIFSSADLHTVDLTGNMLEGNIPGSLMASIASSITDYIGEALSWSFIELDDNYLNILTRDKPDEFFKFSKLQTLLLSCNHLTGAIPASLSSVTTLYRFAADQNSFSGWIVGRITKHVKMLYLSCNMLTGEIPSDIFSSAGLHTVDLTCNMLEGNIPGFLMASIASSITDYISEALSLSFIELDDNYLVRGIHGTKSSKLLVVTTLVGYMEPNAVRWQMQ